MKFSPKQLLAALGVAACVAAPTLADSVVYSNALSAGGAVATTPVTKKSSVTGAPALVQFTAFANYDSTSKPLTVRVRTQAGVVATGIASAYGTETYTLYYNSGYGNYGDNYVARIATHTGSNGGASFTVKFTP